MSDKKPTAYELGLGKRAEDLTGRKFGRLLVIRYQETVGRQSKWLCLCDCGKEKAVIGATMKIGRTTSCGCHRSEAARTRRLTHGLSGTKEYGIWATMKERAKNPDCPNYKNYGGRGITVCDRWLNSFEAFIEDMGPRPEPKMTIERIDNEKGYSPDNCIWADWKTQAGNRRNTHMLTHDGKTQCIRDWEKAQGFSHGVIRRRVVVHGWTAERAITTPAIKRKRRK